MRDWKIVEFTPAQAQKAKLIRNYVVAVAAAKTLEEKFQLERELDQKLALIK